jgi:hypothetical protein
MLLLPSNAYWGNADLRRKLLALALKRHVETKAVSAVPRYETVVAFGVILPATMSTSPYISRLPTPAVQTGKSNHVES